MPETALTHPEPQRLRALEHANAIRLARADLKRRIANGEVSAADVILGCPDAAQRWTVAELLMAQRRWGVTRCRKFLEHNSISEIKPIGSLTERQRQLLASQLGSRGVPLVSQPVVSEPALPLTTPLTVPLSGPPLTVPPITAPLREFAFA
jgi:hypothetical protein